MEKIGFLDKHPGSATLVAGLILIHSGKFCCRSEIKPQKSFKKISQEKLYEEAIYGLPDPQHWH
jgi:hypothetical protein